MSQLTLNVLGLPYFNMECPYCHNVQTIKVPHSKPHLQRCQQCDGLVVAQLITKKQPNRLSLTLAVSRVGGDIPHVGGDLC